MKSKKLISVVCNYLVALAFCVVAATTSARERVSFNDGWLFQMGDPAEVGDKLAYQNIKDWITATGVEFTKDEALAAKRRPPGNLGEDVPYVQTDFDDNLWRRLNLPHDWGIEGPFKQEYPGETGKLPWWGVAWYRKHFMIPASDTGQRFLLEMDGAMTGPDMRESPGGNPLIIWNQPHVIYLCELLYRNNPTPETLTRYKGLVRETAECLASMVHYDEAKKVYVLGPPLWIAQEIYDQSTSQNPSFELAYWQWALETAQKWQERTGLRRGLKRNEQWDHIIQHLASVPQKDGKYVALGSNPDTWDNVDSRHDHPTMLALLGILPGTGVERATMERTLDAVLKTWDWETKIWGWDYPMIAMTAARLGRPETAVEILLRDGPNNKYLPNGHCPQRSDKAEAKSTKPGARKRGIAVYLPANGAFLSAVAMMAAGWDGNTNNAPGFPKDGKWKLRCEGLHPLP